MGLIPQDLKYTKEHEWVRVEGKRAIIGITDFAQEELGDVVFVELPQVGDQVEQNAAFGTVESVKTVSDLYAPVSGKIVEINEQLSDSPEWVNQDPYGKGWMIVVEMADEEELERLLTAEAYAELTKE